MHAFELGEQPVDRGQPGRAFDLRQNDAVEARPHDRHQIAVAEFSVDGIDPDIEQSPPRPLQRCGDRLARCRLLGGRDRVFEVEDHRIGIKRQRLLDPSRVVARREQETAQRLDLCAHRVHTSPAYNFRFSTALRTRFTKD